MTPEFDFGKPSKQKKKLRLLPSKINNPSPEYFERYDTVETEFGFVRVSQLDWETNTGKDVFTHFEAILNGICYTPFIDKSRLSDSEITTYAHQFIKTIKNAYT